MLDDDNDVTVLFHRIIRYPCSWRLNKSENVELGFIIYNDICQKNQQFFIIVPLIFFLIFFSSFLLEFFSVASLVSLYSIACLHVFREICLKSNYVKIFQQIVLAIFVMSMSVCRACVLSHGAA